MSFEVKPSAIANFGADMKALSTDTTTAKTYVQNHLDITAGDARMFFTAAGQVEQLRTTILNTLTRLEQLGTACSTELANTADMYRKADLAAIREMDRVMARTEVTPEPPPANPAAGLSELPGARLTEPAPKDPIPKVADMFLSCADYISPSHWFLWAMGKVCGVNPAEWIAKELAGDWEKLSKAGAALENLSEFHTVYARALDTEADKMFASWKGNAADACDAYFDDFEQQVQTLVSPTRNAGSQCQSLAYGMWGMAKSIVSLLELLADELLYIAVVAAAGAASSTFSALIGPTIALGVIAWRISRAIKIWKQILVTHGAAWTAVTGFSGVIAGYMGGMNGMETQRLPGSGYDHPAVNA
ncbi:hypothetical protein [Actinocorallia populi]|uniref:hypothetical protein n=1 Tax=Actinocorallia populi TaxID=2079200 RepID=UPI0013004360|nr:hypothetical protein [Actinocorallia populi]